MTIDQLQAKTNDAVMGTGAPPDKLREVALAITAERRHLHALVEQGERIRELASRVRDAQRAYFTTRGQAELQASKRLERELDELLAPAPMLPGMEAFR